MTQMSIRSIRVQAEIEQWPLTEPVRIAGHTFTSKEFLVVRLEKDGCTGTGEAAGVRYRNDAPSSMIKQVHAVRPMLETEISRRSLQALLPPCGARNALDCALWDLEAKLTGRSVWQIAELEQPRPLLTMFTCGADEPEAMAEKASAYTGAQAIKLKLTGEAVDADRVRAVRDARADVLLSIDANQSFNRASLEKLLPTLVDAKVALIEQPFPIGQEALLDGFQSPIAVAADESAQNLADVAKLVGRFNAVNIKLDKCGGLSEGLAIARTARALGLDTMIGNMFGTSLAMAPAFLVGQLCRFADLDGPVFLQGDRPIRVQYAQGYIHCPEGIWG